MDAHHSKSAFVHEQIKGALRSGHYFPGQRIDPAMLAAEFRTSPTPVRFALYRLVGEGLLTDHARNGLYVPLPTELVLRDLYDWMDRLLSLACEVLPGVPGAAAAKDAVSVAAAADLPKGTWQLFDEVARATGHRNLHKAVEQANDQLAPVRRAKQHLIEDAAAELSDLIARWDTGDVVAFDSALHRYHARRRQLVPRIVALLNEGKDRLH